MKYTLLEIVQDILSDMTSDEVNSIDDGVEAMQVAQIIKTTYVAMMTNRNWPHQRRLVTLTPSTDFSLPTHMSIEDEFKELCFINYDVARDGETRKRYTKMKYEEPDNFLRLANQLNSDEANVEVVTDPTGIDIQIQNDRAPKHFTSFDDKTIVFNSIDRAEDSTLQASKVQAMAYVSKPWEMRDDFVPDIPDDAFSALIEESKNRCMLRIKQMADPIANEEARRQQRWLSRKARRVAGGIRYPNYGRRTGRRNNPYFDKDNVTPKEG